MSNQQSEDSFEVAIYEGQEVIFDNAYEPWMTQAQIADLLGIHRDNVAQIISKAAQNDPDYGTTIELIAVAKDGKRRLTKHYGMDTLLLVGFRAAANEQVKAFRRWVSTIVINHLYEEIARKDRRINRLEGALEDANVRAHEATTDLEARIAYELEVRYPEEFEV
jgi:hypothetical protein